MPQTPHAVGAAAASVWGDETEIAAAAVALASRRISKPSDPKTTARPASELLADAGQTITPEGTGRRGVADLRRRDGPATRAQDDPMNLAYIPAAPTRAALAFDAVVSSYNIFAGSWESGAGAIFAENQALAWLVGLLGWPETAGGCFISGGTTAISRPSLPRGSSPETSWPGIRWGSGVWPAPRRHIRRFRRLRPCWTPKW